MCEEYVQYMGLHGLGTTHTYIDHGVMARLTNRTHKVLPHHIIIDVLKRNPDALTEEPRTQLNLVIKTVSEEDFLMVARSSRNDRPLAPSRSSTLSSHLSVGMSPPPFIGTTSNFSDISSISEAPLTATTSRASTPMADDVSVGPPPLQRLNSGVRTLTLGTMEEKAGILNVGMSSKLKAWRQRGHTIPPPSPEGHAASAA